MKLTFGIHRNTELSELNKNYKEWLLKQDFFKEKYTDIYNAIINYKPIKKINYNDLPDDIIEYINNFNAIEVKYRGGKYLPIYYPIKSFDVDQGGFVMKCTGERWLTGMNKGKTFKDYSWGYDRCVNCGVNLGNIIGYYFLCGTCNCKKDKKRKAPLKLHDEKTTNYTRCYGMPIIKNNKYSRVNQQDKLFDFCLLD